MNVDIHAEKRVFFVFFYNKVYVSYLLKPNEQRAGDVLARGIQKLS